MELKKGETIKLTTDPSFQERGSASVIYLDYKNITNVVKPGNRIFIDDGLISVICQSSSADTLVCSIENGGWFLLNKSRLNYIIFLIISSDEVYFL